MADYGTDLACITGLSPECRSVSGLRLLSEAIVRRLTTPRGRVIDAPDYGTDLHDYLGAEFTPRTSAQIVAAIKGELDKDERIAQSEPVIQTLDSLARSMTIAIAVTTVEGVTFRLVMSVSQLTTELLSP
jgi:phage baseplate assembly protein W